MSWRRLWLIWSVLGLGSLLILLFLQELNALVVTAGIWWVWAAPALGSFAVLEIWALVDRRRGDTYSEQIWAMGDNRSIVVAACAWGAFALMTGDVWPSFGAFGLGWCAYHFWLEIPEPR